MPTIAYASQAGHHVVEAAAASLREEFYWVGLQKDASDFFSNCLLCVISRTRARIFRLLGSTLYAILRGEVLYFGYLFLGDDVRDSKYALVLKNAFSGYAWLRSTTNAAEVHTAQTLSSCQRSFTAPLYWFSDQRSQFFNEILSNNAKLKNIQHKQAVAY